MYPLNRVFEGRVLAVEHSVAHLILLLIVAILVPVLQLQTRAVLQLHLVNLGLSFRRQSKSQLINLLLM